VNKLPFNISLYELMPCFELVTSSPFGLKIKTSTRHSFLVKLHNNRGRGCHKMSVCDINLVCDIREKIPKRKISFANFHTRIGTTPRAAFATQLLRDITSNSNGSYSDLLKVCHFINVFNNYHNIQKEHLYTLSVTIVSSVSFVWE